MSSQFQSRGRSRRGASPLLLVTILVLGFAAIYAVWLKPDKHIFGIPHDEAQSLMANRPECPENWETFPLWPDEIVREILKLRERPRGIVVTPAGDVVYTPPNGELPLSGDITNIPEFHDCQRFLSDTDKSQFGSLFAIFAAFQLENITNSIGWDLVTWQSSATPVATVDANGYITAVGAGTTLITARSAANPNVSMSLALNVFPNAAADTTLPPIHLATNNAAQMNVGEQRQAVAQFGEATSSTIAAATIYNFRQGYATLGIGPNFSCLYLYFDQSRRLRAKMVPVVTLPAMVNACLTAVNPAEAQGKMLEIRRTVIPLHGIPAAQVYPPVARWDWDPKTEKQFIGIMCGAAWCEVGEGPFDPPLPVAVPLTASEQERKVLQVQGWHDEQILAVKTPLNAQAVPSGLYGTVIPSPELKNQPWSQTGPPGFHVAAYIAIQDLTGNNANAALGSYVDKLNVRAAALGELRTLNKMSYCYGTKKQCEIGGDLFQECDSWVDQFLFKIHRWWVRIETPAGETKTYCVTRRTHHGFNGVPATARWRWILDDDTVWTECLNGCCQTEGGGS